MLLMCVPSVAAQEASSETGFEVERFSWKGKIPTEADQCDCSITVHNHFGTVRARFGGYEGQVEVFANIQHFTQEPPRLIVETRESRTGVHVVVGYPDEASGELLTVRNSQKKRADMVVWVPRGVPLVVSSEDGLIDIRGLKSDVQAHSTSGDIHAGKIQGNLNLETSNGDIVSLLEGWEAKYDHTFTTDSGNQSITFGGEVDTRVLVSTSGLISTDFSLNIDYAAQRQPVKKADALIGKGSSIVKISSASGHIRLAGKPLASKARVSPGQEDSR